MAKGLEFWRVDVHGEDGFNVSSQIYNTEDESVVFRERWLNTHYGCKNMWITNPYRDIEMETRFEKNKLKGEIGNIEEEISMRSKREK